MLRIAHIALSVSSIRRSFAFYRRHFGFRRIKEFSKPEGLTILILKKDNVSLELFEFKIHKNLPAYRKTLASDLETLGTKHFCIGVSDILAAYNKLRKAGVKFATGLSILEDGKRYFFIRDPDGILVEIMEEKRWR